MKKFIPLIVSIMLFCVPAWAYSMTHLATAKPHQTKNILLDIPVGHSSVEVWGTDKENLNCKFLDQVTKNTIYEITDTKLCIMNNDTKKEYRIILLVTNKSDKEAHLRVWVHDFPNK